MTAQEFHAQVSLQFDELGSIAARVELLAETGDAHYLPQINAEGTAMLRGLSKLRDCVLAEMQNAGVGK